MTNLKDLNINEINLEELSQTTLPVKMALCSLLVICIVATGYFFNTSSQIQKLNNKKNEEKNLMVRLTKKSEKAANLQQYRKQMDVIKNKFDKLVHQLPSDTEVPNLLEDITKIGLSTGLDFKEITIKPEINKEFFIELPILIRATGKYHDLGNFVSGISALKRIVSIYNFFIDVEDSGKLDITVFAYTYRYKDNKDE